MIHQELADGNWNYVPTLSPANWEALAKSSRAVRRLRGVASVGDMLRTLLLHIGHGRSLRTTSPLAKAAGWANLSDVALLKPPSGDK